MVLTIRNCIVCIAVATNNSPTTEPDTSTVIFTPPVQMVPRVGMRGLTVRCAKHCYTPREISLAQKPHGHMPSDFESGLRGFGKNASGAGPRGEWAIISHLDEREILKNLFAWAMGANNLNIIEDLPPPPFISPLVPLASQTPILSSSSSSSSSPSSSPNSSEGRGTTVLLT